MHIVEKAEIHFHQQEQLSVFLESNSSGEFEKTGELGLLTMYALRILSNLGVTQVAHELAMLLVKSDEIVESFAAGNATGGCQLIPFPGSQGRKRFIATFELRENQVRFDMSGKGFGFFGTGLGYYAPTSVIGLFRQLALKRSGDRKYLKRLAKAASACGMAYFSKEITLTNQAQLGASIIAAVCGEYLSPKQTGKDLPSESFSSEPPSRKHGVDSGQLSVPDARKEGGENDAKYELLGRECDAKLGRKDGAAVSRGLHACLEQDARDWFYDRVWKHFAKIPFDQWSKNESISAEFNCRRAIGFLQAVRGAAIARERGVLPSEDHLDWFIEWMLRLTLGEKMASEASREWLPFVRKLDVNGQFEFLSFTISRFLPDMVGKYGYVHAYAPMLDRRIKAAIIGAFQDVEVSRALRAEALEMESRVDSAIDQYHMGGVDCYVLENDEGMSIAQTKTYGPVFLLWSSEELAVEMQGKSQYKGHRVSRMGFRELSGHLERMQAGGVGNVAVNQRIDGEVCVVPIGDMLQQVTTAVGAFDASEIGVHMRHAFGGGGNPT